MADNCSRCPWSPTHHAGSTGMLTLASGSSLWRDRRDQLATSKPKPAKPPRRLRLAASRNIIHYHHPPASFRTGRHVSGRSATQSIRPPTITTLSLCDGYANDLDVLLGLLLVHPTVLNLVHHVQPLHRPSEDGVLLIQPRRFLLPIRLHAREPGLCKDDVPRS